MILCLKKAARRQKFCRSAAKIGHVYFIFKQPHKSGCFLYAPVNGPLYPAYIKQVFDSCKRLAISPDKTETTSYKNSRDRKTIPGNL